jgi:hypothetical protein
LNPLIDAEPWRDDQLYACLALKSIAGYDAIDVVGSLAEKAGARGGRWPRHTLSPMETGSNTAFAAAP